MPLLVVHVDRGWAWGSVVAGFIANFITGGLAKSFGMVMNEFESVFDCPSAYMTLAGGLIYTFMYATSIFVHLISSKVGPRFVVAAGALGATLCVAGASVAENVALWVVLIGVGVGVSLSCIYFSAFVVVGQCFSKRLGLANGISVAGVSVGQIVFPSIVSACIEQYTIRGATLIAAAIIFHLMISAVLMPSEIIRDSKPEEADTVEPSSIPPMRWGLFILFTVAKVLSDVGDVGLSIIFSPMGSEIGISNTNIGYAIACGGVVDLASRLFIGWLSDKDTCRRSLLLTFAWLFEAANGVAMASVTGLPAYIACYVIYGGCTGTAMALFIVVLTDFVSVHHLPKSFAIMMVAIGLMLTPGQFFLGVVKDNTGTYRWSLRVASFFVFLAFLVLLLEVPVQWAQRRRRCNYGVAAPKNHELVPISEPHSGDNEEES